MLNLTTPSQDDVRATRPAAMDSARPDATDPARPAATDPERPAATDPARPAATDPERGDVPGWVLVTLMTAGLVVALWAIAGPLLEEAFTQAISSVTSL